MPAVEGRCPPVPREANGAHGLSDQAIGARGFSDQVMMMLQSMERMQHELSTKIDSQQHFLTAMAAKWHRPHTSERDFRELASQTVPSVATSGGLDTSAFPATSSLPIPPQSLDFDLALPQENPAEHPSTPDASEKMIGSKRSASGTFMIREDADCLTRFAAGRTWSCLCLGLIVANTVVIGAETQMQTQYSLGIALYRQGIGNDVPLPVNMTFFKTADICFLVWMILEVCVNAYAQRWHFLVGADKWWNAFDVAIATLSLAMHLLEALSITFLRVLRLFRLGKILRAFKVIKFMRGVRSMIISMAGSMQHLASACLVMCIVMYTVTLVFMQGIVTDALEQTGGVPEPGAAVTRGNVTKLSTHHSLSVFEFATGVDFGTHWEATEVLYGTIDQSMMTLFLSISNGLAWSLAAEPINKLGTFYGVIWTGFVFFMVFGLLNVLTGIFVDAAIKAMMNDRDNMIAEQKEERDQLVKVIMGVFKTTDVDGSGMITCAEFETLLEDEELVYYLKAIGIDSSEALDLFQLLDDDKSGCVSIDEFVTGFLKLKGSAKAMDMATLMYEQRKILRRIDNLSNHMQHFHLHLVHPQATGGESGKVACASAPEPNAPDRVLSRVLNDISGLRGFLGRTEENSVPMGPALIDTNGVDRVPRMVNNVLQSSAINAKSDPAGAVPDNHELLIQLGRKLLFNVDSVASDCATIRGELEQQRQVQLDIQHTSMQTAANLKALCNVLGDVPTSGFIKK